MNRNKKFLDALFHQSGSSEWNWSNHNYNQNFHRIFLSITLFAWYCVRYLIFLFKQIPYRFLWLANFINFIHFHDENENNDIRLIHSIDTMLENMNKIFLLKAKKNVEKSGAVSVVLFSRKSYKMNMWMKSEYYEWKKCFPFKFLFLFS